MRADIKERWIAALRSGRFMQGRGALKSEDGYCCLGVLAAIQGARVEEMYLDSVGLILDGNDYSAGLSVDLKATLADMNDGRGCEPRSFDHIAGYIRAAIEGEWEICSH